MPGFEHTKQGLRDRHFAQDAREEIQPLARVKSVAVERDCGGKALGGLAVPPEEADELRVWHISSEQSHETFVPEYGFIAVTSP
jgi:uncharacterized 2Fe-2S/4Fe-4S cluster protein (DUF4445 family)